MAKEDLSPKQKLFCEEYIIDHNATQAAIRAGYSSKTARAIGAENLTKPNIENYIKKLKGGLAARHEITKDMIVQELYNIGFADIRKVFDEKGRVKNIVDIDSSTAAAIMSIEVDEKKGAKPSTTKKIRFNSKISALERLATMLDLVKPTTINLDILPESRLDEIIKYAMNL
jgi:phage terminase small subunit